MREFATYLTFRLFIDDDKQEYWTRPMGVYRTYGPFRNGKGLIRFVKAETRQMQRRLA